MFECFHLLTSYFFPLIHHLILNSDSRIRFGSLNHRLETIGFSKQGFLFTFSFGFQFHLDSSCFGFGLCQCCLCFRFSFTNHLFGNSFSLQDRFLTGNLGRYDLLCFQGRFYLFGFRFFHFTLCNFAGSLYRGFRFGCCFTGLFIGFRLSYGKFGIRLRHFLVCFVSSYGSFSSGMFFSFCSLIVYPPKLFVFLYFSARARRSSSASSVRPVITAM